MNEKTAQSLSKRFETPFYVFETSELVRRVRSIRESLPRGVKLCYAVKANTFIAGDIARECDRFEACSEGEYRICVKSGIPKAKIVVSGVNKSFEFIDELAGGDGAGIYTAESPMQFRMLKEAAKKYRKKLSVLLRLTSSNQFGMDKSDIAECIKDTEAAEFLTIKGIQFFSGTQKTSGKRIRSELDSLDTFLEELAEKYGFSAEELEYGAGLPVRYFDGDGSDDDFIAELSDGIKNLRFSGHVTVELGRSIAFSCGSYFTRVADLKTNCGRIYAIADGGKHQITWYGHSLAMRAPKHFVIKNNSVKRLRGNAVLCGSLCSVNDILIRRVPEDDIGLGDVFVFTNVGAYCPSEGMSLFLSRELPLVLKIGDGGDISALRESTYTYIYNMPSERR